MPSWLCPRLLTLRTRQGIEEQLSHRLLATIASCRLRLNAKRLKTFGRSLCPAIPKRRQNEDAIGPRSSRIARRLPKLATIESLLHVGRPPS